MIYSISSVIEKKGERNETKKKKIEIPSSVKGSTGIVRREKQEKSNKYAPKRNGN